MHDVREAPGSMMTHDPISVDAAKPVCTRSTVVMTDLSPTQT